MKYFAVLLLASLCVATYSATLEAEPRGVKSSVVNAANKLKSTLSTALAAAKGKLNEFAKIVGQQKEPVLARLNELKAELKAEAKAILAQAADQAAKVAAQKLVEEINRLVGELNKAKDNIEKLQ